jgi:UDP-N-acetylmuramate dehydrogenase
MGKHTTYQVGGPADYYTAPTQLTELKQLYRLCQEYHIPFFVMGYGANLLVSDKGVRGLVIDMRQITGIEFSGERVSALAGTAVSDLAEETARRGLKGLETFYAMPGSVGGAIWMNARCYGVSISDVLVAVEFLDEQGQTEELTYNPAEFTYKVSPFQSKKSLILRGLFQLKECTASHEPAQAASRLVSEMQKYKKDREEKGHFLYPSAGSVFKNNHAFGEPTGKLIDALGLKGLCLGGAKISEKHGNFIVNTGSATAADIAGLIKLVKEKVKTAYGFDLEEEVRYIGDF